MTHINNEIASTRFYTKNYNQTWYSSGQWQDILHLALNCYRHRILLLPFVIAVVNRPSQGQPLVHWRPTGDTPLSFTQNFIHFYFIIIITYSYWYYYILIVLLLYILVDIVVGKFRNYYYKSLLELLHTDNFIIIHSCWYYCWHLSWIYFTYTNLYTHEHTIVVI